MRVLVTADLHYNIRRSKAPAEAIAQEVVRAGGDAVVLLGDTAGADMGVLRGCLELFEGFRGLRLLVPGNHCLWRRGDESSMDRYERLIPQAAAECGFAVLDHAPVVLGRVGLVGSVGWYDYSMRDESLGVPTAFYEAKLSPGAAQYLGRAELIAAHATELGPRQMALMVRWMDGVHVDLGMSDEAFTELLARRLAGQVAELAPRVKRVAAFMHHLPFAELLPSGRPDRFAFASAFMGSVRLGAVLAAEPKVTDVFCGHAHWPADVTVGKIRARNVGSTYLQKRLDVLEWPD